MNRFIVTIVVPLTVVACSEDVNLPDQPDLTQFDRAQAAWVEAGGESGGVRQDGSRRPVPMGMFGNQPVAQDFENKLAIVGTDTIPIPTIPDDNRFFQGGHTIAWAGEDVYDITILNLRDRSMQEVRVQEQFWGLRVDEDGTVLVHLDDGWSPLEY